MAQHNWRHLQGQWEEAIQGDILVVLKNVAGQAREWLEQQPDDRERLDWLLYVAATYRHRQACQMLLDIGADPSAANEESGTCLHAAVMNGDAELLRFFIASGADLEATPEYNDGQNVPVTPLIYAAQRRAYDLVDLLLKAGANPNGAVPAMTSESETAIVEDPSELAQFRFARLYYIGRKRYHEAFNDNLLLPVSSSADHAMVARLIEAGADLSLDVESTALHRAILHSRNDTVQLLLEKGSPTRGKNDADQSPLVAAAVYQKVEIVQTLVAHGVTLAADESPPAAQWPERIRNVLMAGSGKQ